MINVSLYAQIAVAAYYWYRALTSPRFKLGSWNGQRDCLYTALASTFFVGIQYFIKDNVSGAIVLLSSAPALAVVYVFACGHA